MLYYSSPRRIAVTFMCRILLSIERKASDSLYQPLFYEHLLMGSSIRVVLCGLHLSSEVDSTLLLLNMKPPGSSTVRKLAESYPKS